jgi:hypothetical protein
MNEQNGDYKITGGGEDFMFLLEDGSDRSGVYLTPEYLWRLEEVLSAARTRMDKMENTELPDAFRNLFGILDRLLDAHGEHARKERPPESSSTDDLEKIRKMLDDLKGDGPENE